MSMRESNNDVGVQLDIHCGLVDRVGVCNALCIYAILKVHLSQ